MQDKPLLVSDLETPSIVVDLDVMERNLSRMAEYCRGKNLRLRPHTKSHKIPELAKRQLAHAPHGITVAKIGEAEVMLDAGINDISDRVSDHRQKQSRTARGTRNAGRYHGRT